MPIYEYACSECHRHFDKLVWKTDESVACPACGTENVKRKLSAFSFQGAAAAESSFDAGPGCGRCGADVPGQCQMS